MAEQMYGDQIRIGIHSGQLHGDVPSIHCLWEESEALGFDWISLFDFLRPHAYPPDWPCFEGTTLLAALAARTSRIRCAILVSPVTWRHPAIMANIASTIDHISQGRLEFGVGAGGQDRAYAQYGIKFPPAEVRFQMLDEVCQVLRALWTAEEVSFAGRHYDLNRACLSPKPLQPHLPLIVGTDGPRLGARVVARHADIWNALPVSPSVYRKKLDDVSRECRIIGRDANTVRKSITFRAVVGSNSAAAQARYQRIWSGSPDAIRGQYLAVGSPDDVVSVLGEYASMGVRDFVMAVQAPIDWETIRFVAADVAPVLRGLAG